MIALHVLLVIVQAVVVLSIPPLLIGVILKTKASFAGRTNLYEITAGLDFYPLPNDRLGQNLVIRPEIRYDWSEDKLFGDNIFLAPTKKTQWTAAVDAVFKF